MLTSFVIGQSNYFGFGFTPINCNKMEFGKSCNYVGVTFTEIEGGRGMAIFGDDVSNICVNSRGNV